jgi:hypothetical protein
VCFEKTKPICAGNKKGKVLFGRVLWQLSPLRGVKKQTQFKANLFQKG